MTSTENPVRCSDADRERTGAALHRAVGEGYLTMDEAEERLTRVYAARHQHELAALTADLPGAEPAPARTGWLAVLALAWRQFVADARALVGRGGQVGGRRRIGLALTAAAVLLLLVGIVALAVHGVVEGPDHHGIEQLGRFGSR